MSQKKRDTRKKVRQFLFKMELGACLSQQKFTESNVVEKLVMMVMRGMSDRANAYLDKMISLSFSKSQCSSCITDLNHLYLFGLENSSDSICNLVYKLGDEVIIPSAYIPTIDQLKESYEWNRKIKTEDSEYCENLDMWANFTVREALSISLQHCEMLTRSVVSWEDFLLEGREIVRAGLIGLAYKELEIFRKRESFLKTSKAPEFILEINGREIEHIKQVISELEKTTFR